MKLKQADDARTLRGENGYAAIAEGYVMVPEDGVYYVSSRADQVWIDSKLLIDNSSEVKVTSYQVCLHSQYYWWLAFLVERTQPADAQG